MIRRLFTLALLLAITGGGVYLYKWLSLPGGLVLTGIVTTHDVIASSQIQGRLIRLAIKEGDSVKEGQLLAVLDPQEMQADRSYYAHTAEGAAAQVQEGEAALKHQEALTRDQIRQAEEAVAAAEAQEKEAAATLELSRLNFERAGELFKKRVYAAQTLDQAKSQYEASRARMETARKQADMQRAALAVARSNGEQVNIRLKQLLVEREQLKAVGAQKSKADVRLSYSEIHAPISGIVAVLAARQGEVVSVSQPIASLIDPDNLWVRADLEETYIDRIRLGDTLKLRLPSGAERVGTVFYRGVNADYATQRDVSRTKRDIKTFEIRLRVDNSDRVLWPGLTIYVTLPEADLKAAGNAANPDSR